MAGWYTYLRNQMDRMNFVVEHHIIDLRDILISFIMSHYFQNIAVESKTWVSL